MLFSSYMGVFMITLITHKMCVFIRGEIWLWGGYYMRRGKSYYKKGKVWLYSRISPGERLLYSQFSGGKSYYIASFPRGNLARVKGYYTIPTGDAYSSGHLSGSVPFRTRHFKDIL